MIFRLIGIGLLVCSLWLIPGCTKPKPHPTTLIGSDIDSDIFKDIIEGYGGEPEIIGNRIVIRSAGLVFAYDESDRRVERVDVWTFDSTPVDPVMRSLSTAPMGKLRFRLSDGSEFIFDSDMDIEDVEEALDSSILGYGNGGVIERPDLGISFFALPKHLGEFDYLSHDRSLDDTTLQFLSVYEPTDSLGPLGPRDVIQLINDLEIRDPAPETETSNSSYYDNYDICENTPEETYQRCGIAINLYSRLGAANAQVYGSDYALKNTIDRLRQEEPRCVKLIEEGCIRL